MVKIDKIPYFNLPNCYRLSNGVTEAVVTTDIGPRVIRYGFAGAENMLAEIGPEDVMHTELGDWHVRGGHRLWHAPESNPRTYAPDNDPVEYELVNGNGIRLNEAIEPGTGIEKEILVSLDSEGARLSITHKLTNRGLWPVELAPWALTVMNGGGVTVFPNEPFIPHTDELLPARPMVLWHYTDLSDSRWTLGKKFVQLRTDEKLGFPQKIGVANKQGWAGYLRKGTLFVKRFPYIHGAKYPDFGCNFETYTSGNFMEVESLGPMVTLARDQSAIYVEHWYLFQNVDAGSTDDSMDAAIMPLVSKTA